MPPRIPIVSPRAVIAFASRSVGLTLIAQAISGANIAKKAIVKDAIAETLKNKLQTLIFINHYLPYQMFIY
jgi:F0F1-type ATP synthase membrane subunit c/vacuolar-type H+-ATPase subunit K